MLPHLPKQIHKCGTTSSSTADTAGCVWHPSYVVLSIIRGTDHLSSSVRWLAARCCLCEPAALTVTRDFMQFMCALKLLLLFFPLQNCTNLQQEYQIHRNKNIQSARMGLKIVVILAATTLVVWFQSHQISSLHVTISQEMLNTAHWGVKWQPFSLTGNFDLGTVNCCWEWHLPEHFQTSHCLYYTWLSCTANWICFCCHRILPWLLLLLNSIIIFPSSAVSGP